MKITRFVCAPTILIAGTIFLTGCPLRREGSVGNLCDATNSAFSDKLGRVESGSEPDAISVIRSLSCLDGGNLEDAHIALGEAAFKFPNEIAPLLQSMNVGSNDLIAIVSMLPSEFVDEPCKSRDELINRRIKVSQDAAFSFARTIVLQPLDLSIAEQDKWCKDAK